MRALGFRVFRVRHLAEAGAGEGPRARVQIAPEEMGGLEERLSEIEKGIAAAGYVAMEIDPAGYQAPR